MATLTPAVDAAHAAADLSMVLGRGQAKRGRRELAAWRYAEAARFYTECGCFVLADLADDLADEQRRMVRPAARPNVAALVD